MSKIFKKKTAAICNSKFNIWDWVLFWILNIWIWRADIWSKLWNHSGIQNRRSQNRWSQHLSQHSLKHLLRANVGGRLTTPSQQCWEVLRHVEKSLISFKLCANISFVLEMSKLFYTLLSTLFSVPNLTHPTCWAFVERMLRPFGTAWSQHLSTNVETVWQGLKYW